MSEYNRSPIAPVILIAAGVVLILGAIFWSMNLSQQSPAVVVQNTPAGLQTAALPTAVQAAATPADKRIPYPDIPRITVADAKAAFDAQQALFIDTRGEPYFSEEHIPGAISLTMDEAPSRLAELDPNRWIITYCT